MKRANKSKLKFVEYSAHDSTILGLASLLGLDIDWVGFTGHFLFELYASGSAPPATSNPWDCTGFTTCCCHCYNLYLPGCVHCCLNCCLHHCPHASDATPPSALLPLPDCLSFQNQCNECISQCLIHLNALRYRCNQLIVCIR